MDLTPSEYASIHERAFSDTEFISRIVTASSAQPDRKTWHEFQHLLPPGPVLEIGPGTGYLLAAARDAGREVFGVESSAVHREFIVRTWGIPNVFSALDDIPPTAPKFAAVMLFNTIEHVFDVTSLFRAIRARLAPEAAVLVSTCNAECIILPMVGTYWAMLKVPDHVSLPAAESFRRLALRTGFTCRRVWTGEQPLETPIGIVVALRDWIAERRVSSDAPEANRDPCVDGLPLDKRVPTQRRLARIAMRLTEHLDPTRHVTSLFGRAAAIRGLFAPDSA
jgi:SAM-dependent methyltransferase